MAWRTPSCLAQWSGPQDSLLLTPSSLSPGGLQNANEKGTLDQRDFCHLLCFEDFYEDYVEEETQSPRHSSATALTDCHGDPLLMGEVLKQSGGVLSLCPRNAQQRPELAGPPNTLVELGELQRLVALRTWQGDPVSFRSESTAPLVDPVIKAKSQPPLWAENGGTPEVSCQPFPEWCCILNLNLGPVAIRGHSILREGKHCQLRDT